MKGRPISGVDDKEIAYKQVMDDKGKMDLRVGEAAQLWNAAMKDADFKESFKAVGKSYEPQRKFRETVWAKGN